MIWNNPPSSCSNICFSLINFGRKLQHQPGVHWFISSCLLIYFVVSFSLGRWRRWRKQRRRWFWWFRSTLIKTTENWRCKSIAVNWFSYNSYLDIGEGCHCLVQSAALLVVPDKKTSALWLVFSYRLYSFKCISFKISCQSSLAIMK